ncbi:HxlR family transcriptional regulator [Streptomyces sp. TLI_55]|uniref:winged helix-turn-helix transcriptional regulator n=1 Tax=Streptomyces sp. TLI_55 TaxID=1938861 RepID=UPI000BCC91FD|nr:helix-turn-helix domain-containing protein [Streptomyces sp. TLI_55]SNX55742.1 HxlR family transcriptional regulator [Streptomyces sp. TLI_55]
MSPLPETPAVKPVGGVTVLVTVDDHQRCPATALLRRVDDKWSPVLLSLLAQRSHGFNELDRSVQRISRRMLVRTLRSLERDGLISRTLHPGTAAHETEMRTARARYDAGS